MEEMALNDVMLGRHNYGGGENEYLRTRRLHNCFFALSAVNRKLSSHAGCLFVLFVCLFIFIYSRIANRRNRLLFVHENMTDNKGQTPVVKIWEKSVSGAIDRRNP